MPENAGPKAHGGAGNRAKGTYQDRDKPSQIRFSNISAGKGEGRRGLSAACRSVPGASPAVAPRGEKPAGGGAAVGGCAGRPVRALAVLRARTVCSYCVKAGRF